MVCKCHLPMFTRTFKDVHVQTKIYDHEQIARVDTSAHTDTQWHGNRTSCMSSFIRFGGHLTIKDSSPWTPVKGAEHWCIFNGHVTFYTFSSLTFGPLKDVLFLFFSIITPLFLLHLYFYFFMICLHIKLCILLQSSPVCLNKRVHHFQSTLICM